MKKVIIVAIVLAIVGGIMALTIDFETTTEAYSHAVKVYVDKTDPHKAIPTANTIIRVTGLEQDMWHGVEIELTSISEFNYNQTYRLSVPAVSQAEKMLKNELDRRTKIDGLKGRLDSVIQGISSGSIGRGNSVIYLPVARGLNELAKSKADDRTLVVYSDLAENSELFDSYNQLLNQQEVRDSLRKRMQQVVELSDLSGINVWLIYQPTSMENDKRFSQMYQIYEQVLESKGAKVSAGANLPL